MVLVVKDFNINWIGWYGTEPSFEIETKKLDFNTLKLNFLNDQRHWIFTPKKIIIYGYENQKWKLLEEKTCDNLAENDQITTKSWEIVNQKFSSFIKIKVHIKPQTEIPNWRKRKNKKPMVMIDEVELYKK